MAEPPPELLVQEDTVDDELETVISEAISSRHCVEPPPTLDDELIVMAPLGI